MEEESGGLGVAVEEEDFEVRVFGGGHLGGYLTFEMKEWVMMRESVRSGKFCDGEEQIPNSCGPFILSSGGPRNFRSGLKIALSHHEVQKGHGFCRFPAKSVTIIHIVCIVLKSLDDHLVQAFAATVSPW